MTSTEMLVVGRSSLVVGKPWCALSLPANDERPTTYDEPEGAVTDHEPVPNNSRR